jgi:SAM-dependent methyltransferase
MVAPAQRYDTIGVGYSAFRQPDPRIAAQIWSAVGEAARIVNVGAGTGSYEDAGRAIVAVEPSAVMVEQRPQVSAPAIRASAEHLPFTDQSFDAALALLTVHHWADLRQGLAELKRVSARQVVFTFDEVQHDETWIYNEYVPAALGFADDGPLGVVVEALNVDRIEVVPVPADCVDGFALAYWRRPHMYLDPAVRASISGLARLNAADVERGMDRLAADLASGAWQRRHADLLERDTFDAGLRLVVAG